MKKAPLGAFLLRSRLFAIHPHAAPDRGKRGMRTAQKTEGGLTALVCTLAGVLFATCSNATCAADLLATAGGRQARAIGQSWLRGGLAVSFRNDFIAHGGPHEINKTDIRPQMAKPLTKPEAKS